MGVPLVIIHFNGMFHYKPSIWGYPHDYGKPMSSNPVCTSDKRWHQILNTQELQDPPIHLCCQWLSHQRIPAVPSSVPCFFFHQFHEFLSSNFFSSIFSSSKIDSSHTGWWFGCHLLNFPINIGLLSSSQLTNSYFSGRGGPGPPTRNDEIFWLNHRELTRFIGIFWGPRNLCGPSVFDISTWCPGCQTIRYETRVRSLRSTREETLSGLKWDENILSIPIKSTSDVLDFGLDLPISNHGGPVTAVYWCSNLRLSRTSCLSSPWMAWRETMINHGLSYDIRVFL